MKNYKWRKCKTDANNMGGEVVSGIKIFVIVESGAFDEGCETLEVVKVITWLKLHK